MLSKTEPRPRHHPRRDTFSSITMLRRALSTAATRTAARKPTATIVGSGCFGVGAAYFLARKGFDVTVLDKRSGVADGTSWGNASSLRESSFGAGAGPGAMPALLHSLYNHDGTYRLRLGTLLGDTWLWRWGLRFLKTCGDKGAIAETEEFLRDHSPYFNRLTYAIADAEGFAKSVDGTREAMVVFVDCGADGKSTSDGTEASAGTASAYASAKAKASTPPPVPWAVTHALTPAETAAREPALKPTLAGALAGAVHAPHDSLLDSHGFTTSLAKVCASRYGVKFVHGEAGDVTSLARRSFARGNPRGGVDGVHTADGGYRASDIVVVATGAQAPRLLAPLGIDAPIYPVKGYSLTYDVSGLAPSEAPTGLLVVEPAQMYVSRMGKRLRFTSIAEFAGWEEDHVAEDCVQVLRHRAESLFPAATVGREPQVWAGGRPLTPDDRPISCRAPESTYAPNLYIHSGGGAYGWRVSMGVSQQLADSIASDGYAQTEEGAAAPPPAMPSLDQAEPRTTFEPSLLSVERFTPLPLFPRALFGW